MTQSESKPGGSGPPNILERIRKVLALAKSSDVHEAAAAMGLAQKLMARYWISEADLEADKPPKSRAVLVDRVVFQWESQRAAPWHWHVVSAFCHANRCHGYMAGRSRRAYMARGTAEDLDTVAYLVGYVVLEIDRLCDVAMRGPGRGEGRAWANSFRLGAAAGVASAIKEADKKAEDEARSEASDPLAARGVAYRKAIEANDVQAVLALDKLAPVSSGDSSFALARVDMAIARVRKESQAILVKAKESARRDLKLKKRKMGWSGASRYDGYGEGVKAGKSINTSSAQKRIA